MASVLRAPVTRRAILAASAGAALAACERRSIDAPAELRIATGPPGAVYREVGGGLAAVLAKRLPDTRVRALPTGASVENLRLLAEGRTELAIAQLDAAAAGLKAGVPADLTAVARLYDSWLHLVIRRDAPIRQLTDLDGHVVATGARESGTEFTVGRLLRLVPSSVRPRLVALNQAQEAAALRAGRIDAFFSMSGVPTPAIATLADAVPIAMVPLAGYAEKLNDQHQGEYYTPSVFPSSAYPGVPATEALSVANLLLAQPSLAPDLVEFVATTLFAESAQIAQGHPEARRINIRTGIATGEVRLHPGAVRYFRARKP